MSQQDNFSGGFLLGTIVGGVVGGVLGALLVSQRQEEMSEESLLKKAGAPDLKPKGKKRPLRGSSEQNIELARRSLEDKIAQLNDAIDDVRQQLSSVNGRSIEVDREGSLTEEP
jgi:hypothetical protein